MKNYEKPSLKFASLRNQEAVADVCWGEHGNTTKFDYYMDKAGAGFYRFSVNTAGNCSLITTDVVYLDGKNDQTPTPILPGTDEYNAFLAKLKKEAGGNDGNPFDKKGGVSENPGEGWSYI